VIDVTIDSRRTDRGPLIRRHLHHRRTRPSTTATRISATARPHWLRIPSSIEQAVARVLDRAVSTIPGASLCSDSRAELTVERVDATDWVIRYQDRKYLVLTDDRGCMLSASLPDRRDRARTGFRSSYPDGRHTPPRDHAGARAVSIRAAQGRMLAGVHRSAHHGRMAAAVLITGLSPHERNNSDAVDDVP
jgi:hypothetical protein